MEMEAPSDGLLYMLKVEGGGEWKEGVVLVAYFSAVSFIFCFE